MNPKYPSAVIDATQPYKVRASCGHIDIRRMRPSTAGVPYSADVVLDAPNGAPCEACQVAARRWHVVTPEDGARVGCQVRGKVDCQAPAVACLHDAYGPGTFMYYCEGHARERGFQGAV
jgi:hypothetical protein